MNHKHRIVGICRHALVVVAALIVPLAVASPALAVEHHPKGDFANFADCPLITPELNSCVFAQATSGEFTIGKKTVPINKTITLQGGFTVNPETGVLGFVGAEDGNTLSKTALYVPGGLFGIEAPKSWPTEAKEKFNKMINEGLTGVTATTELAAPASSISLNTENLIDAKGTALSLPVKVKLSNTFLGSNCYIGSNSSPIVINFTTGTTSPPEPNKPITGKVGTLEFKDEFTLIRISNNSLVNNSFAAPGATGCGGSFSSFVDPLVNTLLGLPSAAGHNTAILNGTLETAAAEAVKASE
ncbi:MAG TPA: hypothetical protein VII53_01930 [Solirubrobacteraceae bacterium]